MARALHGTPGPKPRKPLTIVRDSGKDNTIPDMPDPAMYGLTRIDMDTLESLPLTEWPEVCRRAWESIFTSELAANYVDSDRLQAEAAITYLAESVNPQARPSDKRGALKQYEAALERLGLNPAARSKLKISIATEERMTNRRAAPAPAETAESAAPKHDHDKEIAELYARHTGTEDWTGW